MAGKGKTVVMLFGQRNKGTDGECPPFVWTGDRIMGYISNPNYSKKDGFFWQSKV